MRKKPSILDVMWLFNKYNKLCFDGMLPRPMITLSNSKRNLGRFTCEFNMDDDMFNPRIEISDRYMYTEEKLSDILVHEMIHYYLAYNKIDTYLTHKKDFIAMMNDFNMRFGMDIEIEDNSNDVVMIKKDNWFTKIWKIMRENMN